MLTQHYLSFLVNFQGIRDLQCCKNCHIPSAFSFECHPSMTIFYHKLLTREGEVFGQWMNSSIIHDNSSSLTHKKCHAKYSHNDIKYNKTLNIIFNVVTYRTSHSGIHELHIGVGAFGSYSWDFKSNWGIGTNS